jgi:hypothetical protein
VSPLKQELQVRLPHRLICLFTCTHTSPTGWLAAHMKRSRIVPCRLLLAGGWWQGFDVGAACTATAPWCWGAAVLVFVPLSYWAHMCLFYWRTKAPYCACTLLRWGGAFASQGLGLAALQRRAADNKGPPHHRNRPYPAPQRPVQHSCINSPASILEYTYRLGFTVSLRARC